MQLQLFKSKPLVKNLKFRKKDYSVKRVSFSLSKQFIQKWHYAGTCGNASILKLGLFDKNDQFCGVAIWNYPAVGCSRYFGLGVKEVLALSRLAIHPSVPKNAASYLIGQSIRLIKKTYSWIKQLVTYADTRCGHTGTIYKATNWEYLGRTVPYYAWIDSENKTVSCYSNGKKRNYKQMDALYQRIGPYTKHRFGYKI